MWLIVVAELNQVYRFGVGLKMLKYDPKFPEDLQSIRNRFETLAVSEDREQTDSNISSTEIYAPWDGTSIIDESVLGDFDPTEFGENSTCG